MRLGRLGDIFPMLVCCFPISSKVPTLGGWCRHCIGEMNILDVYFC